jgi:hypothetical protein
MDNAGVVEGDLPTERKPEAEKTTIAKLLFAMTGLYERWRNEMMMETRRYRDPRENDPNYGQRLRELEGQIAEIDREQQRIGFHGNYTEGGGDKRSWKDWILTIVGAGIILWLGRISLQLDDLSELKAAQKGLKEHQEMTDKHLENTDSHVERIENRVYRGSP